MAQSPHFYVNVRLADAKSGEHSELPRILSFGALTEVANLYIDSSRNNI